MLIGISGHQRLQNPDSWEWVRRELENRLASFSQPIVGVTSLAIGADTLFARVVLELGGSLKVVVPFEEYEEKFEEGLARQEFRDLLSQAAGIEVLQRNGTHEEAYYAAGMRVADLSELMILVWNGKPAAGLGGTADIAEYALQCEKSTIHLNPVTREVTSSWEGD
jgi:hypothetical protein